MKKTALLTLVGLAACAQAVVGQTVTASSTFTAGTYDIYDLSNTSDGNGTNLNGSQDYSNSAAPGQTFTTGSSADGYDLTSVTLQGGGSAGYSGGPYYYDDTYNVAIYALGPNGGANYALTYIGGANGFAVPSNLTTTDYLTFTLPSSVLLAPDTTYAFTVNGTNGSYYGFAEAGETYSGGDAINNQDVYDGTNPSTADGGTTFSSNLGDGYDRTFDVGLSEVGAPEPSTWALFGLGIAGLVFLARRRLSA